MRLRHLQAVGCLTVCAVGAACSSHAPRGLEFRLLDTLILGESDTAYLGRLGPWPIVGHGGYYVQDELTDRVFHFSLNGTLDLSLGRHGRGPGEFDGVGPLILPLDSLLIVQSTGGARLTVFDVRTRKALVSRTYAGDLMGGTTVGDTLLLGIFDPGSRQAVARLPIAQLLSSAIQDSFVRASISRIAAEYEKYPNLATFGHVIPQRTDSGLLVGFGGTGYLVLERGTTTDTLLIPTIRRRGVSEAALKKFTPGRATMEELSRAISTVLGIWRRPNGGFIVWYQDPTAKFTKGDLIELTGRAFLTALSPDLTRACVDGEPPAPVGRPRLALNGDTLISLDQVVDTSNNPRAITVIRRYLVRDEDCDWRPVRRVHGSDRLHD